MDFVCTFGLAYFVLHNLFGRFGSGKFVFVDFVQLIFFGKFCLEAKVDTLEQHIEIIDNE